MKTLKIVALSVLLVGTTSLTTKANTNTIKINLLDLPAKTVCIKHPEAADANKYFASATVINFEVYKAGSTAELDKIVKTLSTDKNIESCTAGKVTGDFSAITLSLKTAKDKAYFVGLCKKAGLTHFKLNNNTAVEADKL